VSAIKVRVTMAVEIDPEAWGIEYGMEGASAAEIRADVKRYIEDAATQQLQSIGVLA